jgi:hypothetical protein
MIDVSDAEGSDSGNGHDYFRSSPWVSSDIIVMLLKDLNPEQRGLVMKESIPVWEFPSDYIDRLAQSIASLKP